MMFGRQISFLDRVPDLLDEFFRRAIEEHDLVIKDYIVEKQLFEKGIDGNEKRLAGYTRITIKAKLSKRPPQPVDRTTTRDTGQFHLLIDIVARSDGFEVQSNVPYDKFILKRYGRNILKITNGNMRDFLLKFFIPNIKHHVKNQLTR